MAERRVGILGAGSIGCYLGGLLAAAGVDVVFVGRERVKAQAEAFGLVLTDLDAGAHSVAPGELKFAMQAEALEAAEVVLVAVKSAQTADAGRQLSRVLKRGATAVSMQNGIRNADVLREHMPEHRVLAGIVGFNVVAKGNGVFRRATTGPLVIEATSDPWVMQLARLWTSSGLEVELRADVRALQWSKLVMNLNNAVSALSGSPTPRLLFEPGYRRVLRSVIAEAVGVMRRAGVKPARFGTIPVALFPILLSLPTPLLRIILRAQLRVDPEARSSMWEDLCRGRPTEVDELNGEIVRLADSIGSDAPVNRRVVQVIHSAEQRGPGSPELSPDALARALGLG